MQFALSRLFPSGSRRNNLHKEGGLLRSITIRSSTTFTTTTTTSATENAKLSGSKKAETAKTPSAATILSNLEYNKPMHPGVFPLVSFVIQQVEAGSSYLLKDYLPLLKEDMSIPPTQKQIARESLSTSVNTATSEALTTSKKLDTAELDKLKSVLQLPEWVTDPHTHQKDTSITPTSRVTHIYSEEFTGPEDSSNSAKIVLAEPGNASQQSEIDSHPVLASCSDQKMASKSVSFSRDGSVSEEKKPAKALGVACSSEDSSIENENDLKNEVFKLPLMRNASSKSKDISAGRYDEVALKPLTSFLHGLVTEEKSTGVLGMVDSSSKSSSIGNEEHPPNMTLSRGSSEQREMSSLSSGSVKKVFGLADLFMKAKMDTEEAQIDTFTHEISSGSSKGISTDDPMKKQYIGSLLDTIKNLPTDESRTRSNNNELDNGGLQMDRCEAAVTQEANGYSDSKITEQLFEASEENSSMTMTYETFCSQILGERVNGSDSCDASLNHTNSKPKPDQEISCPRDKSLPKRDPNLFLLTEKGRTETDVFLKFLKRSSTMREIRAALADCGPIDDIRFIYSSNYSMFKDAYVRFKTKEGLDRALSKTDIVVGGLDVVLEAGSPLNRSRK